VADVAVVDTSPCVYLVGAGLLDLLRLAAPDVTIPRAAMNEVDAYGTDDPVARTIRATSWLRVVDVDSLPSAVQEFDLGDGESAVIAWALAHPGSEAILDDLQARKCAQALGVTLRGTLGLVLLAKQCGVMPEARPALDRLCQAGMYLSDRVMNRALSRIGE
jgi:predicted nucleic acid-binding protein